jgi:hypothetical protein
MSADEPAAEGAVPWRPGKNQVAVLLFLASVGLALIPAGGAAAGPAVTPGTAVPPAAAESGALSCSQLESLWEQAGGDPAHAFLAAEVAKAESGGRQYAVNQNTNGSTDRGYWQVNSTWGALSTFDPLGNAKAAVQISGDGTNWTPWMTYDHGAENGQC